MHSAWYFFACIAAFLAASPIGAEETEHHGPALVLPGNGAVVERQVTVRIGFIGHAPHGPAEDSGISFDRPPPPDKAARLFDRSPTFNLASDGTGLRPGGDHRPAGPHFALLVDAPVPVPGSNFTADEHHIPFPPGIPQMTLPLDPGQHSLTLLSIDPSGFILPRTMTGATIISVR